MALHLSQGHHDGPGRDRRGTPWQPPRGWEVAMLALAPGMVVPHTRRDMGRAVLTQAVAGVGGL